MQTTVDSHPVPESSPALEYRQLGQTDLRLSVIGFGASPLGDVFGREDPTECTAAVRHAIDRGVNFFDTSPYYGATLSEKRLGEALDGYRDRVVLATKCGRYGGEVFDFSARTISAGLEDSLRRLRTGHVDLLQAHDVEFGAVDQIVEETIPAMRRLQEQGKTRYVGITGFSLKNLIAIASRVKVDSILSYCRYNLLMGDLEEELIPMAEASGIGVINASALHMGMLTAQGAPAWHPAGTEVGETARKVMELCAARGASGSAVALKFCFSYPKVASTLVGMSTRAQVDANLAALHTLSQPALLAEISALVKPSYNRLWPSGREENYG